MAPGHRLRSHCSRFVCRELYHDREEITLAGIVHR
jgi:23S rRNA C2498 (ribose-2'-O)-methylase RlmM